MTNTVRARWTEGIECDLMLPDGSQLHVQPRHVYEVPEAVVKSNPDAWKVQADQGDDELREAPAEEPNRRVHTQTKAEPHERAIDSAPREEG